MFRDMEEHEPNVWDRKGLVRLAIVDGRFKILHPDLNAKGDTRADGCDA